MHLILVYKVLNPRSEIYCTTTGLELKICGAVKSQESGGPETEQRASSVDNQR
jgi:hypothetical protein